MLYLSIRLHSNKFHLEIENTKRSNTDNTAIQQFQVYNEFNIAPYSPNSNKQLQDLEHYTISWMIQRQFISKKDQKHKNKQEICNEMIIHQCTTIECGLGCQLDDYVAICAFHTFDTKNAIFDIYNHGKYQLLREYGDIKNVLLPPTDLHEFCGDSPVPSQHQRSMGRPNVESMKYWVPHHIKQQINKIHSDPSLWFHGVWNRFMLRLNDEKMDQYKTLLASMHDFEQKIENIYQTTEVLKIGVHVRRTDKTTEADIHEWNVYVPIIKHFMEKFNVMDNVMIVLATDDPQLIMQQIVEMSPEFSDKLFFNSENIKRSESTDTDFISNQRGTKNALKSVVFDALLLSDCDIFIGQDSSRVSRLILQLFAMRYTDYKQRIASVDHYVKHNEFEFPWWMI